MERCCSQILITQLFLFITVVILCLAHVHVAGADGSFRKTLNQSQVVPQYRKSEWFFESHLQSIRSLDEFKTRHHSKWLHVLNQCYRLLVLLLIYCDIQGRASLFIDLIQQVRGLAYECLHFSESPIAIFCRLVQRIVSLFVQALVSLVKQVGWDVNGGIHFNSTHVFSFSLGSYQWLWWVINELLH